ncbi:MULTISPECIES: hypothetical protein [Reichenbachiella]|uniref:hypothetical protein n=1 Tax=Reichenbachiella TaxID=156993 RepID=UPI000E6D2339|nr:MULTISPECIES: hypothetical protein [Reichenbachiella]MBU2912833.1 hypothetical protein [Reichenbachiella agariperforans]RJE70653.1 hypothetical protein BGP76_11275 [Reichenbachiella sp. MSK19-1]
MKSKECFLSVIMLFIFSNIFSQAVERETVPARHFVGSTMFVLASPILSPSPKYYQLNYGYRLTPKDVLSIEAITWQYQGPLGRSYGSESDDSDFPGAVRAFGVGLAYKHFLWKGSYTQIHVTPMFQNYLDEEDHKIKSGFQLFNTLRFGYHFDLFKGRFFIEPSIAFTYWPINTNLPDSFQVVEDQWNNYFLFEPGLHFGFNF